MQLDKYQDEARKTALYQNEVVYPAIGLAGETGEVAELIKKWLRDEGGALPMSEARQAKLRLELGDVLWYVANLCSDLGLTLNDVAKANLAKLKDRQARDKLKGDGDKR